MKAPAQHLLTVTDAQEIAHLVTEESMTAGHHTGRYATMCGHQVLTASLTTPARDHCKRCARRRTAR